MKSETVARVVMSTPSGFSAGAARNSRPRRKAIADPSDVSGFYRIAGGAQAVGMYGDIVCPGRLFGLRNDLGRRVSSHSSGQYSCLRLKTDSADGVPNVGSGVRMDRRPERRQAGMFRPPVECVPCRSCVLPDRCLRRGCKRNDCARAFGAGRSAAFQESDFLSACARVRRTSMRLRPLQSG